MGPLAAGWRARSRPSRRRAGSPRTGWSARARCWRWTRGSARRRAPDAAVLLRALSLIGLLWLSGCALSTDRLRWKVARADRVALQNVVIPESVIASYDLDHPRDLLPADAAPRSAI